MNFTNQYYQISPWFWENSNKREEKMTGDGLDEKEFEEWLKDKGKEVIKTYFTHSTLMLMSWLASRRSLREQIDKQLEKEGWEDNVRK